MDKSISIHVDGIVQGVGFRPFVARLARSLQLQGWVLNSAQGVDVLVQGPEQAAEEFSRRIAADAPAAAVITGITAEEVEAQPLQGFQIVESRQGGKRQTLVSADLATCPDCLEELLDPGNRRYRYPFINCTCCGPRFTIINGLPYDRPATSMAGFTMCPECAAEYAQEEDRRYHAQPDACFACGPHLWGRTSADDEPVWGMDRAASDQLIAEAAARLKSGQVLAVKGLGGWHLACDATNPEAVRTLRERKHRPTKPLAIMVPTLEEACKLCAVSTAEAQALATPAAPIVLMAALHETTLAPEVAGVLPEIGVMLPSTPLQHLLTREAGVPLVMTSGNRSGEPIVADDADALEALGAIADWFLGNDRPIVARYDDSVLRVSSDGRVQMVRRARGFAPVPLDVAVPDTAPAIFAAGPEQKATFCTLSSGKAYISQHLGDLETLGAWEAWNEARSRYQDLFDTEPQVLACDMHPEYLSSKQARKEVAQTGMPLAEVQHHHAHIASVLGENNVAGPVIGVALDGTGYGTDGRIWGCEVMEASQAGFQRLWHLPYFALPGGAAAIKDPRRTAYALLKAAGLEEDPRFEGFVAALPQAGIMSTMIEKGLNSPLCSSAGRLFDGMAALLGLCATAGYDGEPACLLEARAWRELDGDCSGVARQLPQAAEEAAAIPSEQMLAFLLAGDGATAGDLSPAAAFHLRLAATIICKCMEARRQTGLEAVALSGGCLVNRMLRTLLVPELERRGFTVYENRDLPPNDGCIAYGQAIVANAQLMEE